MLRKLFHSKEITAYYTESLTEYFPDTYTLIYISHPNSSVNIITSDKMDFLHIPIWRGYVITRDKTAKAYMFYANTASQPMNVSTYDHYYLDTSNEVIIEANISFKVSLPRVIRNIHLINYSLNDMRLVTQEKLTSEVTKEIYNYVNSTLTIDEFCRLLKLCPTMNGTLDFGDVTSTTLNTLVKESDYSIDLSYEIRSTKNVITNPEQLEMDIGYKIESITIRDMVVTVYDSYTDLKQRVIDRAKQLNMPIKIGDTFVILKLSELVSLGIQFTLTDIYSL